MNSKKIYGIQVTKFNENHEIIIKYVKIALFTSLKKAYSEIRDSARFNQNAVIDEENTPNMHVFYDDSKGVKTLETIETYLLQ